MAFVWQGRWVTLAIGAAVVCTMVPGGIAQEKGHERGGGSAAGATASSVAAPDAVTEGSVTVNGQAIAYKAVAGTITVGATDAQDATLAFDGSLLPDSGVKAAADPGGSAADGADVLRGVFQEGRDGTDHRPVMFLYNGGPGSATMWLHMGTFGPRRIVTPDTEHQEGAPYTMVNNQYSPAGHDRPGVYRCAGNGVQPDLWPRQGKGVLRGGRRCAGVHRFIRKFLTKYERWNSPKYLFGESYGTPRSAVLSADLQGVDLNGIVLLSQILSFDNTVDDPTRNPGVDQAYALALPTYAATAWYYHKLPNQPPALKPFLDEVEKYALSDYMEALLAGSELPEAQKQAVAEKLHDYTGLPVDYLMRANLRVTGGEFSKELKLDDGTTMGRLDTRYQGPDVDPLSESTEYDPQSDAITSAWVAAIKSICGRT